jgi:hypothetical protein
LVLLHHGPLVPIPAEQMTVERCLDGCAAAGYNAAALEDGQVRRDSAFSGLKVIIDLPNRIAVRIPELLSPVNVF